MKKTYITPEVLTMNVRTMTLLGNSDAINGDTLQGMGGYGGVDEEGTKDPSARRFSVWDDEEEED
jgi:hypothetical protein